MNKGRKKTPRFVSTSVGKDHLHFRLCHICLHLNESSSDILQCHRCQRYLTIEPLLARNPILGKLESELDDAKWDDEREEQAVDGEENLSLRAPALRKRTGGLHGLAVLW